MWLCRNPVNTQCVILQTPAFLTLPRVVFSKAFASSEFNFSFFKKLSLLFRAGLANLSILENTLLFTVQSAYKYDSYILEVSFGDEHMSMFADSLQNGFGVYITDKHSLDLSKQKKHPSSFLLNIDRWLD